MSLGADLVVGCHERYVSRLECDGQELVFSRADFVHGSRQVMRTANTTVVLPNFFVSGGAENAAWTCDGGLVARGGVGYGRGTGVYAARLSGMRPQEWTLVASASKNESACVERVSYMKRDKCAFDGKLSVAGDLVYARANRCRHGGRHVQVLRNGSFTNIEIDGVDAARFDTNLYFFVAAKLASDTFVGGFPGTVRGRAGVFVTTSMDGIRWSTPYLVIPSKPRRSWRTLDHIVDDLRVSDDGALQFSVQHGVSLPRSRTDEKYARQIRCDDGVKLCPRCYRPDAPASPVCRYKLLPVVRVIFAGELRFRDDDHLALVRKQCADARVYVVTYAKYRAIARILVDDDDERLLIVDEPDFVDRRVVHSKDTTVVSADWFSNLCRFAHRDCNSTADGGGLRGVRVAVAYPGAVQWGLLDIALRAWFVPAENGSVVSPWDVIVRARTDCNVTVVSHDRRAFSYGLLRPAPGRVYCHSDKLFYARADTFLRVFAGFRDAMMADFNHHARSIANQRFYSESAFAQHLRTFTGAASCDRPCLEPRAFTALTSQESARDCNGRIAPSLYPDRRSFTYTNPKPRR